MVWCMCYNYIGKCISMIEWNRLISLGLLLGLNISFLSEISQRAYRSVCRRASLSLSSSFSHPWVFHRFIRTCLFHVQFEVSASVALQRCKYLCLLLNYYFSSEFPKAFNCLIMMFPLKKKKKMSVTILILKCFWESRPRTVFYTEYVSVPLCLF